MLLKYQYQHLFLREVNLTRYGACTKQLARKKGYHFVALLKLYLLILASFIKIGVCYQKLSTLQFHYQLSSHCVEVKWPDTHWFLCPCKVKPLLIKLCYIVTLLLALVQSEPVHMPSLYRHCLSVTHT